MQLFLSRCDQERALLSQAHEQSTPTSTRHCAPTTTTTTPSDPSMTKLFRTTTAGDVFLVKRPCQKNGNDRLTTKSARRRKPTSPHGGSTMQYLSTIGYIKAKTLHKNDQIPFSYHPQHPTQATCVAIGNIHPPGQPTNSSTTNSEHRTHFLSQSMPSLP
jgi:hypothetical protein